MESNKTKGKDKKIKPAAKKTTAKIIELPITNSLPQPEPIETIEREEWSTEAYLRDIMANQRIMDDDDDIELPDLPSMEVPLPAPWTESTPQIKDIEVAKKMLKIFQSANDRNLEYDLSFTTVKRLMSYKKCYYTGKEFTNGGLLARSFDRVDSAKGYVEGNVVSCTVDINQKKSNLSLDEITILYKKLVLKQN